MLVACDTHRVLSTISFNKSVSTSVEREKVALHRPSWQGYDLLVGPYVLLPLQAVAFSSKTLARLAPGFQAIAAAKTLSGHVAPAPRVSASDSPKNRGSMPKHSGG